VKPQLPVPEAAGDDRCKPPRALPIGARDRPGAMGIVYLGRDTASTVWFHQGYPVGTNSAIRTVEARSRFFREAETAAASITRTS